MIYPEPTGDYQTQSLMSDWIIYHYDALPASINATFSDYTSPHMWRNYHQPFAVAIVQPATNNITLIRDHWGISHLYYCHLGLNKIIIKGIIGMYLVICLMRT